jgi:hypothetical protein
MRGKQLVKVGPAWAAAGLVTTATTSLIHSWQVQQGITGLGVEITPELAVQTGLADLAGLSLPVFLVFGLALAFAFAMAAVIKPRLPMLEPIAWPLAGSLAVATALLLMRLLFEMTPLAGARGLDGLLLFCGAGALGGLVFAWLKPR